METSYVEIGNSDGDEVYVRFVSEGRSEVWGESDDEGCVLLIQIGETPYFVGVLTDRITQYAALKAASDFIRSERERLE